LVNPHTQPFTTESVSREIDNRRLRDQKGFSRDGFGVIEEEEPLKRLLLKNTIQS
jgi:hypothetical protein